jgi:hypothetical protein
MAWNGSGAFARTNGTYNGTTVWQQDEAAAVDIEADRHDTHDQDLAAGINACLAKNGENSMTGDLNMGSNDIVNAGSGAFTSLTVGGEDVISESATLTAGTGISVSGTFATAVTVGLSHLGFQSLTDPNADRIVMWDDSAGATAWLAVDSSLTISGTTLSVAAASDTVAGAVELATDAEALTGTATNRAITPANLQSRLGACGTIFRNTTQGPITSETKLQFNASDFDALKKGAFDTSTNYRYTAGSGGGKVLAIARVTITDLDSGDEATLTIKKNGTIIARNQLRNDSGSNALTRTMEISKLVNMGASEYLEVYLTSDTDGVVTAAGADDTALEIVELD